MWGLTCKCGGMAVIRNADVVCQTCGLVLMSLKASVTTSVNVYEAHEDDAMPARIWQGVQQRIQDESANDARFLKALGIKPMDE